MSNELSRQEYFDSVISQLHAKGVDYGAFYPAEELRTLAGPLAKTENDFAFFKMQLRESFLNLSPRKLLTERGLNGAGMRIAQRVEHYYFSVSLLERADAAHVKAELLLEGDDQGELTEAERQRDANLLREIKHRRMMLRRAEEVYKVVRRHKPALLHEDVEAETSAQTDLPE